MMQLIPLAQPAQNRNRVFHRRLVDQHRLEAPLQRRVFLDMFAIFVERRRADAMQLAARQHRLQQVARIHRAFGLPRADHRMQLVDKQNDLPFGRLDLFENGFQPLLELAAELRPRDQRAHVERNDLLVLQPLRDVAAHDPLRQPFDDGRLPNARLADQHRIVLGPPRQHLDHAPDLLVAPDHRVEFPRRRQLGQIASILFERLDTSPPDSATSPAGDPRTSCSVRMIRSRVIPNSLKTFSSVAASSTCSTET